MKKHIKTKKAKVLDLYMGKLADKEVEVPLDKESNDYMRAKSSRSQRFTANLGRKPRGYSAHKGFGGSTRRKKL